MIKYNSHQLRVLNAQTANNSLKTIKRQPLVIVLEDILDTYNIGSFFRLADALGVTKLYLPPTSVTPPNLKIHRASVGTWKLVPWEQYRDIKSCLTQLKKEKYHLYGVEQDPRSVGYNTIKYATPTALIMGSESQGLSPQARSLCHTLVEIPQWGFNRSLNVLVAAAIVGYQASVSRVAL